MTPFVKLDGLLHERSIAYDCFRTQLRSRVLPSAVTEFGHRNGVERARDRIALEHRNPAQAGIRRTEVLVVRAEGESVDLRTSIG